MTTRAQFDRPYEWTRAQFDRPYERITTHLRAHVAELRRLEHAGAAPGELQERRELIARLQGELAELVRRALAPRQEAVGALR